MNTCSIEGCGRPASSRGYCRAHYKRFLRHGDPLGGKPTMYGDSIKFIMEEAVNPDHDECIIWPFFRNENGYGKVQYNGSKKYTHRVVCEIVNGPPPTDDHEAAHSCGGGSSGCCSGRHLRWATKAENEGDKLIHGTRLRGSRLRQAVLTEKNVLQIAALKGVISQKKIGEMMGLSDKTIANIHSGANWSWLTGIAANDNQERRAVA